MLEFLKALNPWRTIRELRADYAELHADREATRAQVDRLRVECVQARRAFWCAIDSNHGRLRVRARSIERLPPEPSFGVQQDSATGDWVYTTTRLGTQQART